MKSSSKLLRWELLSSLLSPKSFQPQIHPGTKIIVGHAGRYAPQDWPEWWDTSFQAVVYIFHNLWPNIASILLENLVILQVHSYNDAVGGSLSPCSFRFHRSSLCRLPFRKIVEQDRLIFTRFFYYLVKYPCYASYPYLSAVNSAIFER